MDKKPASDLYDSINDGFAEIKRLHAKALTEQKREMKYRVMGIIRDLKNKYAEGVKRIEGEILDIKKNTFDMSKEQVILIGNKQKIWNNNMSGIVVLNNLIDSLNKLFEEK